MFGYGQVMTGDEDLSWLDETDAVCLTVARGLDQTAFCQTLLEVASEPLASRAEALAWVSAGTLNDRSWLAVGEVDGCVFAWEANGWLGSDPGMTERLSVRGDCASVFWNVNMDSSFAYARNGALVRHFDPVLSSDAGGAGTLAEEVGLDWAAEPIRSALRLQSRLMACRLASPEWLGLPGVAFFGRTF